MEIFTPLSLMFWCMLAAYLVHILDETLMNDGFVAKVQEHWVPRYNCSAFFGFNVGLITINTVSILLFNVFGGWWVVLPLCWATERFFNGVFHIAWSVGYREYSPGLVTSGLFFIMGYFIFGWAIVEGNLPGDQFWTGFGIGLIPSVFMSTAFPFLIPWIDKKKAAQDSKVTHQHS